MWLNMVQANKCTLSLRERNCSKLIDSSAACSQCCNRIRTNSRKSRDLTSDRFQILLLTFGADTWIKFNYQNMFWERNISCKYNAKKKNAFEMNFSRPTWEIFEQNTHYRYQRFRLRYALPPVIIFENIKYRVWPPFSGLPSRNNLRNDRPSPPNQPALPCSTYTAAPGADAS